MMPGGERREHKPEVRDQVDVVREELEAMLLRMPEGKAEQAVREATGALSRLLGRSADDEAQIGDVDAFLASVRRARTELRDDGEEELLVEIERQSTALRTQVVDQVASFPVGRAPAFALPFVASVGLPGLFDLPFVPAPEILPVRAAWDAEADASVPGDEQPALPRALTPADRVEVERLGRDAMEDIGILGGLRRLYPVEPWSAAIGFEDRLLANLDLLFALARPAHGGTPPLVVPTAAFRYATEWAVPDWGRSFALALSLGCARGPAALRWVILALRRAPELIHSAFVDGLSLGTCSDIDSAVIDLLRDATPPVLLVALRVLERRRVFSAGAIVPLLAHPDEDVALHALACLRHAPEPVACELASRVRTTGGPRIAMAALRELAMHGDVGARAGLRVMVEDAEKDRVPSELGLEALTLLALIGDPADAERVLAGSIARGAEHLLGFYGMPEHFGALWAALEKERIAGSLESPRRFRLEAAVGRLTGIDATGDPETVHRAARERLASVSGKRIRAGRAHDVRTILDELADPTARQAERRDLVVELAVTAPTALRLDADTWVAKQRAEIQSVRDALGASRRA